MILYDTEVKYQNFGSGWLIVLRGTTEKIERAFNAFFNFCGTNGVLTYQDGSKTTATFWSSRTKMEKFFAMQYWVRHNVEDTEASKQHVADNILAMENSHEAFLRFTDGVTDFYASGQIKAERSDTNAKDAFILEAYATKDDSKAVEEPET